MTQIKGYNIAFKFGNKTLAGVTQDDLSISAETKESITKANAGTKQKKVVRQNVTFSCQGIVDVTSDSSVNARDAIIAQALKKDAQAVIAFVYSCGVSPSAGKTASGNCIMTAYSESSGSEEEATWNATFEVVGNVTLSN